MYISKRADLLMATKVHAWCGNSFNMNAKNSTIAHSDMAGSLYVL